MPGCAHRLSHSKTPWACCRRCEEPDEQHRAGLVQEQLQRFAGDDCVEVATHPSTVHVRDTKDRRGPQLVLSPAAWRDFVAHASRG
ncbi:DUF397 domain-containing protein [Streptomyces parvulus]|uniref:DUF397 domain-containing protein n=1 Tax=Streptomyces parvulus TaxID=146923 RepID=UPI00339FA993